MMSALLPMTATAFRPPMTAFRLPSPTMVATVTNNVDISQVLEECILSAASEDDVGRCLSSYDEAKDGIETRLPLAAETVLSEADQALEACILAAPSEDDVRVCMETYDELKSSPEDESPKADFSLVEECILSTASEVGVRECMEMYADDIEVPVEEATPLEQCILGAASEDEVQACLAAEDIKSLGLAGLPLKACLDVADADDCMRAADEASEHAYG